MATSVSVSRTNNAEIDGLLGGTKWTGTVTYSFPDSSSDYAANYSTNKEPATGFSQAPGTEQQAINYAVALIVSYTNLSIQFAGTNGADIRVAQSSAANPTSYAYYPSNSSTGTGGDVWFGNGYDYSQAKLGNYYFTTAIHELGHAVGLKHSQELGGVANVAVPAAHDDSEFTVMSYRSYVGGPLTGYTNEAYGYPQTYMANDILALQTLYGANFSTHAENTVYSWNPNTGQEFINGVAQPAPGGGAVGASANRVFMTIWDGDGIDTYDLSNYAAGVTINLNPGASSITSTTQIANLGNGHYSQGNVYNAYLYNNDARSYIDNAIGGAGNDGLTGNAIGNNLNGGAGNDTLTGGAGNDTIVGGFGTDTAVFGGSKASYQVAYNSGTQTFTVADQRAGSPDGTDSITGVENFQFADGLFVASSFTVNHAPVLTIAAANVPATAGQWLQATSLFSATDPDNDALIYFVYDNSAAADSGHFAFNGTVVPAQTFYGVTATQLGQLAFVAGAAGASDDLMVWASDGRVNSLVNDFHVNVNANQAPILTVASANVVAIAGQSLQATSLFSATDVDNDALAYYVYDNTSAADSGHFAFNGTAVPARTFYGVTATQLGQLTFVAGAAGASDDLMVWASDGRVNSLVNDFHVNVNANQAPILTVASANVVAIAGQSLQATGLFSATDVDNDALAYYVYDNTSAADSGHFAFNGAVVPARTFYGVTATQLGQLTFVAGAAGASDDLIVWASDGRVNSLVSELHIIVNANSSPVAALLSSSDGATTADTLTGSVRHLLSGSGNDAFVFASGSGQNKITDLLPGLSGRGDGYVDPTAPPLNTNLGPGASFSDTDAGAVVHLDGTGDVLPGIHIASHISEYLLS